MVLLEIYLMLGDILGEKGPGAFAEFPSSSQKLPQSQLSKKDNLKSKEEIRYLRKIKKMFTTRSLDARPLDFCTEEASDKQAC